MVLEVLRALVLASQNQNIAKIRVSVVEEVAEFLNNQKRHELAKIEEDGRILVTIRGKADVWPEFLELECADRSGNNVPFSPIPVRK